MVDASLYSVLCKGWLKIPGSVSFLACRPKGLLSESFCFDSSPWFTSQQIKMPKLYISQQHCANKDFISFDELYQSLQYSGCAMISVVIYLKSDSFNYGGIHKNETSSGRFDCHRMPDEHGLYG